MQKEKDFVTMEEGFQYFTTMHPPISEEERIRIVNYQSPKGNWLHGSSTLMGASNNIGYVVTTLTRLNQPL